MEPYSFFVHPGIPLPHSAYDAIFQLSREHVMENCTGAFGDTGQFDGVINIRDDTDWGVGDGYTDVGGSCRRRCEDSFKGRSKRGRDG